MRAEAGLRNWRLSRSYCSAPRSLIAPSAEQLERYMILGENLTDVVEQMDGMLDLAYRYRRIRGQENAITLHLPFR